MQTIKLEKPKTIEGKAEWARGWGGMFAPININISGTTGRGLLMTVSGLEPTKGEPICLSLTKKNWAKIVVAIGKELSQ